MLIFIFVILTILCLLAFYFGANEFVVKPLISKRKKQGKELSGIFLVCSWGLGFLFLVLGFLSYYLENPWKIIPLIILVMWIWLIYLKN